MFGSIPIRIIFAIQTRSNSNEMISIQPVLHNKKQYLDLLLLADEQETMIDRYLERGEMFVLSEDGSIRASCVVTREAEDVFEIKNIAVYPQFQRRGYGKKLIQYLFGHYAGRCRTMLVGIGDSPLAIPFYENCGFTYSHRIPDFFTDNYDHPIYEAGKQLKDMVYLKHNMDE